MDRTPRTDWARIDAMTDADIDTSDIPPLTSDFFETATLRMRVPNDNARLLLLHLEPSVFDWFRAQGDDYEDRMKNVLKQYAEAHGAQQKAA